MDTRRILPILLVLISLTGCTLCYDYITSRTLYENLTNGYNINIRPSDLVLVRVEFSVLSLNELDVREQAFTVSGWFTLIWTDPQLTWTSSDYNNITMMFFKYADIWKPELVLTNAYDGVPVLISKDLQMKVMHNGIVTWEPPGAYRISCDVDITYYPFDTQTCYVTLSTWSYDNRLIELAQYVATINFDYYSENGEWTLLSSIVTSDEESDRNENSISRDKLQFSFTFQRKSMYYAINVIFPPLVTAFLGLTVFILPAESGEKVGFSITVLLALAVLLTIVTTYIPTTSKHTSILGLYLVCMMSISSIEVIITILVLRIHHKADKDTPVSKRWQTFANSILVRTSLFKLDCFGKKNNKTKDISDETHAHTNAKQKVTPLHMVDEESFNVKEFAKFEEETQRAITKKGNKKSDSNNSIVDQNTDSEAMQEFTWPEIALMIDTSCFFIMLTVMIVSNFTFFLVLATHG